MLKFYAKNSVPVEQAAEAYQHAFLRNNLFFNTKIANNHPTNKFKAKLKRLIKGAHSDGILNKKETRYLIPDAPKILNNLSITQST